MNRLFGSFINLTDKFWQALIKVQNYFKIYFYIRLILFALTPVLFILIFYIAMWLTSSFPRIQEFIFALTETIIEKTIGKETPLYAYTKTYRDNRLYSEESVKKYLLQNEYNIDEIQVNFTTLLLVNQVEMDKNKINIPNKDFIKYYYEDLRNIHLNLLSNQYKNNFNEFLNDLRKITNSHSQKPHHCLEGNIFRQYFSNAISSLIFEARLRTNDVSIVQIEDYIQFETISRKNGKLNSNDMVLNKLYRQYSEALSNIIFLAECNKSE